MCRIAGFISPVIDTETLKETVISMCTILKHGGPDDEGIYVQEQMVLGHRRLSIIDISDAGHQPMQYGNNQYTITYNGELYNYQEIKKELLSLGALFTTQSDTEVILAAYAHWGTDAFDRFNGMFAFGIWDNQKKELVIARDHGGIKPVYYGFTAKGFAFASEVKAFKTIPWLDETNTEWPVYFMAYGHLPEPITLKKNIVPLGKGNFLVYKQRSHTITIQSFARYSYIEKISNKKEAVKLVHSYLDNAVKRHLISDAPIGVFLSGGLDSSIVAALADKHQAKLEAVSIYFKDQVYSERTYQDLLKKQLSSCNHHQFLVDETDFHNNLETIIQSMDLPCSDGINSWFISKYARESGLKAVLSGIGGDEFFGGYPSFRRMNAVLALEKLPGSVLKAGRFSSSKKLRRLAYLSLGGAVGRYLFLRGQAVPADIAVFLDADEKEVWQLLEEKPGLPSIDHLSPANQASWMEVNMYMQNQLLRDADVMSMAHGLEIRVPFLDKEFVEMVLKISSGVKYQGKPGKRLLIDAFADMIPRQIWDRPKMGFSFPFREWLSDQRYTTHNTGKDLSRYHQKLKQGNMHWSQFFSLMLLNRYLNV